MEETQTELVFVYGTLKSGGSNHSFLRGSEFIKKDSISGLMFSCPDFPMVIPDPANLNLITGEVYEITKKVMKKLDWVECHPDFYCREKVITENGLEVWVYFYKDSLEGLESIPSGNWNAQQNKGEE